MLEKIHHNFLSLIYYARIINNKLIIGVQNYMKNYDGQLYQFF